MTYISFLTFFFTCHRSVSSINRRYIFFLLLALCLGEVLFSQKSQYRFDHIDVAKGLSQNTVNDIFQDREGYLWIATQDGLNRYDGYDIKQYLPNRSDSTSISDNFLWNITEDETGNIWVCSRNAVSRFNKEYGSFTNFFSDPRYSPTYVVHSHDTSYVLASNNIFAIPSGSVPSRSYDSLNRYKSSIVTDNVQGAHAIALIEKELLIFTNSGVVINSKNDVQVISYPLDPGSFVTSDNQILRLNDSTFVLATTFGLRSFNTNTKKISPFLDSVLEGSVYALAIGPKGHLWTSTDQGIQVLDLKQKLKKDFTPFGEQTDILTSEIAFSIYQSNNGILWLGTSNNGLYSYDPKRDRFKFLRTQEGLSSNMIWSIAQTENEYWLGTDNGVSIIETRSTQNITSTTFLPENVVSVEHLNHHSVKGQRVNMIHIDERGRKWISVHSIGLFIFDSDNGLIKKLVFNDGDRSSNQITSVQRYGESYWVSTFNGMYVVNDSLIIEKRLEHEKLSTGYFFNASVESSGKLWIGANNGFYRYDVTSNHLEHFPYDSDGENSPGFYFVNDMAESVNGNIWLATFGGGIDFFDGNSYQNFGTDKGLANNVVSSILRDKSGILWLGTNRGISRFNPQSEKFINFSIKDGLVFNETAINSRYQNPLGEFFFGTAGGLIVFHPDSIKSEEEIPPPKFTGIKVNYEDVKIKVKNGLTLDLYPKDKVISLEFASLAFRNADRLKYEFKIEGIDDQWVVTDANNRRATYSTLPFGTHTLQVRTRNIYGNVSEASNVVLVIHPPYYLTWWFITGIALLIVLIVIASSRTYFRYKLKMNLRDLEVKQQLQDERERISKDLHDNVGSQITHIISSLDNMAFENKNEARFAGQLEDLSDFTRSTMNFLREAIWVINKDTIPTSEFVDKVSDYCDKITSQVKINLSINTQGNMSHELNPSIAINMFRVIQEGVNNAIKHSNGSKIEITLLSLSSKFKLVLTDDGVGFDGKAKKGHHGLLNISDRVAEMEGTFVIKSSEKGTTINIEVPRTQVGQMPD